MTKYDFSKIDVLILTKKIFYLPIVLHSDLADGVSEDETLKKLVDTLRPVFPVLFVLTVQCWT